MAYFSQMSKNCHLIPILSCTFITLLVLILTVDMASSRIIKHHRKHGPNSTTGKTTEGTVADTEKRNDSSSTSPGRKGHHTLKFCQGPGCKSRKGEGDDDHKPIHPETNRKKAKSSGRMAGFGRGMDGDDSDDEENNEAAGKDANKTENGQEGTVDEAKTNSDGGDGENNEVGGAGNKTEIGQGGETVDKAEINSDADDDGSNEVGGADNNSEIEQGGKTVDEAETNSDADDGGNRSGDGIDTDMVESERDGSKVLSIEEQAPYPDNIDEEGGLNLIFNLQGRAAWTTGYVKHAAVEASCNLSNPCLASNLVLPLCGSDEESYLNPGVFQCAQKCNKRELKVYQVGPCPNYVMPPEPAPTTTPRPKRPRPKHQTSKVRITIGGHLFQP